MDKENFKNALDIIAGTIPKVIETTGSNSEKILALLGIMTQYLEELNELAEDSTHPDFDENLLELRQKIFDLMNELMTAAVEGL